jgi:L-alanine-DL-glutamate epimerase-like enolase superfamily enzyme
MRIARVERLPLVMRKEDPKWRFALGANPTTEGIIFALYSDTGVTGYGYASATPHMGATTESLTAALDRFEPILSGRDAEPIEETLVALDDALQGNNQAKAAVDCALHDLNARARGIPLVELLGGKRRDEVPILRILGLKMPDEMALQAQKLVDRGYRYLKIKIEGDADLDLARVRAIRNQVGPDIHLTVDANQSYSAQGAIAALSRMAEFAIDLAEQPVRRDDFAGLKQVTDAVAMTVEADESANSLAAVGRLVSERAVDAISLKIPKLGGLRSALAAARLCEEGGVQYRMGAAVGSRLLSAQAMHLAAALPRMDYACELGEFERLLDDAFEGIDIQDGRLKLPQGPGSGVSLKREQQRPVERA